jgi:hypothetical protein
MHSQFEKKFSTRTYKVLETPTGLFEKKCLTRTDKAWEAPTGLFGRKCLTGANTLIMGERKFPTRTNKSLGGKGRFLARMN